MRKNIDSFIVAPTTSVVNVMESIDKNGVGIAFICEDGSLKSVVTDGDIRRHILSGKPLESPIAIAANPSFISLSPNSSKEDAAEIMRAKRIDCVPVTTSSGKLVGAYFLNDTVEKDFKPLNLPVIIMAGGKGTRLYPYTKILPKPLIPIGDKTITEHIMDSFIKYECNNFIMIVNHKKHMIKAFFADEDLKYNVSFFDEDEPLGTGGGLGLLKSTIASTFFMSNCDVLIFDDYSHILEYHNENNNIITMVCATKTIVIPYGTIQLNEEGHIKSMEEKPCLSFLTNTGFYIIEPKFLDYIPENQFIHITDIIQICMASGENVGTYPISESQWSDMGQLEEMEKMKERLGG